MAESLNVDQRSNASALGELSTRLGVTIADDSDRW
jgi:hypothetical protein